MLQHFVLCNWGLFFSYWSGRPTLALSVLLLVHVIWVGLFEFESGASREDLREFALFRPLSLLIGVVVGGGLALIIDKPRYPEIGYDKLLYHTLCLIATLAWIGTGLAWQLAPQEWWNYLFLVHAPQLVLTVLSFAIIAHQRAWNSPEGSNDSLIVHWHFLVVAVVLCDVPFVIGQSVSDEWAFYFSAAFFAAATLYVLFVSSCHRARVATYLPTSTVDDALPRALTEQRVVERL